MRTIAFVLAVLVIIMVLYLLNRIPGTFHGEGLRQYSSLEDVRESLRIRPFIPRYFPENLSWPPERILAQKVPYEMLLVVFKTKSGIFPYMAIRESRSVKDLNDNITTIEKVTEEVELPINGKRGILQVGTCDGIPCSRIFWQEEGYHIEVFIKDHPSELLKVVRSMSKD